MVNRAILCFALIACCMSMPMLAQQATVRYIYDDLGRLVGVIEQSGDAAMYTYDAVGNLLSITRTSASSVSIIALSPNSGPVGSPVMIDGTGFSSTASANTVTFNGTVATVSSVLEQ